MRRILTALIFAPFLASCFGSKPISYFNGNIDTSVVDNISIPEPVVQSGDLLSITIYSDNPDATAIYNQAGGAPAVTAANAGTSKTVSPTGTLSGYLVDNSGYIRMHEIGELKAAGLTKSGLTDEINRRIKNLGVLTNPYCVVRFNNFKVTVMGEVKNPGVFTLPAEKASVIEALGLAGDMSDYALKDKVLVIREDQGKRKYHYLNMLDPRVFSSPYFYLRQNDVVMVQVDKRKPTAMDQQTIQYIGLAATLMSTLAILISIFK
jgi:polysaccharide export outer membrane protein